MAKTVHSALHNPDWPSYLQIAKVNNPDRELRSEKIILHDIENRNRVAGTFEHEGAICFNDLPINIKQVEAKNSFANLAWKYYFDRALGKSLNLT